MLKGDNSLFKDIKAPLKSGKIAHYKLSWYRKNDNIPKEEQLQSIINSLNNIRQTVSDAPRKYTDNALDIIKHYYSDNNK